MPIISTGGTVHALTAAPRTYAEASQGSQLSPTWSHRQATYGAMYRAQPEIRVVADFLARNVAQLGLHVYARVSDIDRVRLIDHGLAQTIKRPNPATTRYRLFDTTMLDFAIYWNAYWLKVRLDDRIGLLRLPPEDVTVEGGLLPRNYKWALPDNGGTVDVAPGDIVHFRGYGVSPMETLRHWLAEAAAASQYREHFWRSGARIESVITRPVNAPKWKPGDIQIFREDWQRTYGMGAANYGGTAILEDGMELKPYAATAQESEYISGVKLGREMCAAAYHIPQPFVGLLDHATFSNVKEQHKQLYQDTLGPWLVQLEEDIELQLLQEYEADLDTDVYCEFNIAEKLKGSFEEQSTSLYRLTGRPIMTVNEARARLNLPQHEGDEADHLAIQPGTGGPQPPRPETLPDEALSTVHRFHARQAAHLAKHAPADRAASFDLNRWTRELADDLQRTGIEASSAKIRAAWECATRYAQLVAAANGTGA